VEFLQQTLQNHPRLRATRIYHMIRERGYVEASRSCDAWSPACDRRDGKLSCDSACIPLHFQTWQDKAGNALPITDTDKGFPGSTGATVIFMDLKTAKGETNPESLNGDTLQANLIMPEPCHFLNQSLGPVAIIRPTSTRNSGAVASVMAFVNDGLFIDPKTNKNTGIVRALMRLAQEADEARRRAES
jgi:hypothetical protein